MRKKQTIHIGMQMTSTTCRNSIFFLLIIPVCVLRYTDWDFQIYGQQSEHYTNRTRLAFKKKQIKKQTKKNNKKKKTNKKTKKQTNKNKQEKNKNQQKNQQKTNKQTKKHGRVSKHKTPINIG